MNVRVGIPRSLFYFKFIPLWETFFNSIGVEVVVSEPTNKRILEDGVKVCVDEACLPIKLFHGHVINLKDKVDYIFIPRFTSISKKEYVCPEFGGLPDMVRHTLKDLPPLISTEINLRNSEKGALKAVLEIAAILGVHGRMAKAAFRTALENLGYFKYQALCGTLPFSKPDKPGLKDRSNGICLHDNNTEKRESDVSRGMPQKSEMPANNGMPASSGMPVIKPKPRIAVIGHPYNIYDEYISMNLIGKLKKYGFEVVTIEMVEPGAINAEASKLGKPLFWNYGRNAYGAAIHLASQGDIAGMICVSSFGCGIDSMVCDLIERRIRREFKIPFIIFTMDEHSGEAGFNTRLEAFIDMLHWRKQNESNISALG